MCEFTHMNGACNSTLFLVWGPGKVSKGYISLNFNYKVNFKHYYICIPNFVCVLTNKRYKTHHTGYLFCCLGHALEVGLVGVVKTGQGLGWNATNTVLLTGSVYLPGKSRCRSEIHTGNIVLGRHPLYIWLFWWYLLQTYGLFSEYSDVCTPKYLVV